MIQRLFFLAAFLLYMTSVSAQIFEKGLSAGISAGVTKPYVDTHGSDLTFNWGVGAQYHFTSYTSLNADFSKTVLSREQLDRNYRAYYNDFSQFTLTANVRLGQFLPARSNGSNPFYYNFYFGTGLGFANSDVTLPSSDTTDLQGGKRYSGTDLIIPVNLGLDFRISKSGRWVGDLNYQLNYSFSDALDGYASKTTGTSNDVYTMLTVGIKYNFGKLPANHNSTKCYY